MNKKILCLLLVFALLMPMAVTANASNISDASSFQYSVNKSESDAFKDCLQAELYCSTDGAAKITTLGCTIVIDTNVIDTVNSKGEVNTSNYLSEAVQISGGSSISAAKIGSGRRAQSFAFNGLSIASYNSNTKELYIFLCGMNASGLTIPNSYTKVAELYLKPKSGASLTDSSIRIMKESEYKNEAKCPCASVYPAEISSKQEVAALVKSVSIDVDSSLITKAPSSAEAPSSTEFSGGETTAKKDETTKATKQDPGSGVSIEEKKKDLSSIIKSAESLLEEAKEESGSNGNTVANDEKAIDTSTEEGKKLEKAIAKAKEVLTSEDATEEEVQKAINELNQAVKDYNDSVNGGSSNKMTVVIIICAVAAALIAAVVIIFVTKKKKDKEPEPEKGEVSDKKDN